MTTSNNKKNGNRFEKEFCEYLGENGFWAHNFAQSPAGQPADVIAVKEDYAFLIDCKLTETDAFRLSRIEPNQWSSMQKWDKLTDFTPYFAIKFVKSGEIYMVPYHTMRLWNQMNRSQVTEKELKGEYTSLPFWVRLV